MFLQNLKYGALSVPDIIGVPPQKKKIGQPLDTPTFPFLQNFNGLLFALALQMYPPNLKSVALPVPEIRGVAKLQTPNLEDGDAIKGRGWYRPKERC